LRKFATFTTNRLERLRVTFPPFRLQRRAGAGAGSLHGRSGKETLRFPLPVPARLAVIDAEFHLGANMKAFAARDIGGLVAYAPEALALPQAAALSLAEQKLRGLADLPSLRFAIVVLSSLESAEGERFSLQDRDLLWSAFGLPIFEQLRGWDGRVIARECEVHDGLHFDANAVIAEVHREELFVSGLPTSCRSEIVAAQCECGLETPRLRWLDRARTRVAAA
jgi:hypothetical protein